MAVVLAVARAGAAQPVLSVSTSEVASGATVTVTITGQAGTYWALVGSTRDNGFSFGGAAFALGTDLQILGNGVIGPGGTVSMPFVPPLGNGLDVYFLQAATSLNPAFTPLTTSNGLALRPRGFFTNAPTFASGLSAGGARVTAVGTPTAASDAATKSYVDVTAARIAPGAPQPSGSGSALIDLVQTGGDAFAATPPSLVRLQFGGLQGGVAVAPADRFRIYGDGAIVASGVHRYPTVSIPASGPGTRFMWLPQFGALRVGNALSTEWDLANVDEYSYAFGNQVIASGYGSVAFGDTVTVTSTVGFGAGNGITVSGTAGTAFGASHTAAGFASTTLGYANRAMGQGASAIGYRTGACGDYTIALGYRASTASAPTSGDPCGGTVHTGAFVFGDESTTTHFGTTADNEFAARAAGGFRFRTNAAAATGCNLPAGSGVFACASDRNLKEAFTPVDGEDLLSKLAAMPIERWSYLSERGVTHLGPTAQDFRAAFGLGVDDVTIGHLDEAGVALRAAQALEQRTRSLADENARLTEDNLALRRLIDDLGRRLADLERRDRR